MGCEQGQRMGVGCIWARDGMRGDESVGGGTGVGMRHGTGADMR